MYLSFFGLREHPFNLTPDPRFIFMSRSHLAAFDHLLFGIHERKGFMEVVGGVGTGKTTLCRALLAELGDDVATALILNPFLSELELLRCINLEFGLDGSAQSRNGLVEELNHFLLDRAKGGGNACLILDECQNLSPSVLEQIRMLSNLETSDEKLIQIVLVGQPEFHQMLGSEELRALNERIQVRCFLEPLSASDTSAYINHRLRVAGAGGELQFADSAIRAIYGYARGNPRRTNAVCDRAMLLAYARGSKKITEAHVRVAVQEISWNPVGSSRASRWSRLRLGVAAGYAFLTMAGLVGGWALGRLVLTAPATDPPAQAPEVAKAPGTQEVDPVVEEGPIQGVATESLPVYRRLSGMAGLALPEAGSSMEEVARRAGWEAVRLNLGFDDLLRFRRACVLETRSKGQELWSGSRWAVLRGVSEAGVWLQYGASALRFVSREELEKEWWGSVWVWIPAATGSKKLRPGVRGERVTRLQVALAQLGHWEGYPTGLYDGSTRKAVAEFQKANGLAADGRAGPRTMAMLLQLLGEEKVP
jgi:general secretion pathway protein A